MNKEQEEQFDKSWEKLKAQQSNYLKKLYPNWNGDYDGSEPAELAELMNTSYYKGYDCGLKAQRQEIVEIIRKTLKDNNISPSDMNIKPVLNREQFITKIKALTKQK